MQDENVKVTAALVRHPPVVPALGYRFDAADRSIVISGDTAPSDELVKLAQGADVLVHEALHPAGVKRLIARVPNAPRLERHLQAHHTSAEDAGRLAQAAGVKMLVLSHLVPPDDPAITDEMWIEAARTHFRGPVVLGQGITVAYERSRGLRDANQASTGKFQVSVSKTVPARVAEVARAIGDAGQRARWLRGADPGLARPLKAAVTGPKARTLKMPKEGYARLRYPWDPAKVEIHVYAKPNGASVVASNSDLPEAALVEQRRAQWRAALESLQAHLAR